MQHGYGILDLRSDKATGEFWYCNKLAVDSTQKMDAAFELYDTINHWNRRKLTVPTIPLLQAAPLAPYELVTAVLNAKTLDAKVELYPNPAQDLATLKIVTEKSRKTITIKLVDIATGKTIKDVFAGEIFNTKFLHIDISDLASQTVLVVITSGDEVLSKKLVIAK